jgi:phenylalanyl-tRNA synthetase alpha chain
MAEAAQLIRDLQALKAQALAELQGVADAPGLEVWRVAYLGRREGRLTQALRAVAALPAEERRIGGTLANDIKTLLTSRLAEKEAALKEAQLARAAEEGRLDVTLPGHPLALGRLHPTTQILRQICQAFVSMGFQVVEGPEVEWERYNFEMLNIPEGHPARDMWDTLWVDYVDPQGRRPMLLRTHTSPMQARIMQQRQPPVRVLVPGKVYRYEATDPTHEWHFFQVEGLAVDEGITFAHMKGTLYEFARRIFGPQRKVRFSCSYFPFVEPGAEMAIDCFTCSGTGRLAAQQRECPTCRGTGWIEIMGAGMVHPRVLEMAGYDPARYTGFAFGLGAERIAMLKYGIDDIRLFYSNDLRFLRQF